MSYTKIISQEEAERLQENAKKQLEKGKDKDKERDRKRDRRSRSRSSRCVFVKKNYFVVFFLAHCL